MDKVLDMFGLTPTESNVYLTLLELGQSTAGVLARKAGIHRRSAYDATSRLVEKGLVGYMVKNNKKFFEAVDPDHLLDLVKEKEEALSEVLPQLKQKYKSSLKKQETLFFKGVHGLKVILEDQLECGQDILVIGASSLASEVMRLYVHWFEKRRVKKKVKVRLIYNESERKKRVLRFAEVRYLPRQYESPAAINVYGENVAIIHWSKEKPFAILIRDESIARGYQNYGELLWEIAKP